jgi:hypothetical protein
MHFKSILILLSILLPALLKAQEFTLPKKAEKEWFDIRAKAGVRHYSVVIEISNHLPANIPNLYPPKNYWRKATWLPNPIKKPLI